MWGSWSQHRVSVWQPRGINLYKVVLESSWTVIVVTASVKEDERGG
jgi:hypothetical protein